MNYENNARRNFKIILIIVSPREKINRINVFLTANKNKQADIICDESIIRNLGQELPIANYKLVNLSDFIDKNIRIYD